MPPDAPTFLTESLYPVRLWALEPHITYDLESWSVCAAGSTHAVVQIDNILWHGVAMAGRMEYAKLTWQQASVCEEIQIAARKAGGVMEICRPST